MNVRCIAILLWLASLGMAHGAPEEPGTDATAVQAERQSLARQRGELDAQYAREQAACRVRFSVSDCLDAARLRHSAAVDPLIRRQQALDSAERAARARAARAQTAEREAEAAADAASRAKAGSAAARAAAPQPVARQRNVATAEERRRVLAERDAKAAAQAGAQRAQRAARDADFAQRQQQAQQRGADRAAKLDERGRKAATPLPEPSASAIEQFKAQSQGASAPR